MLFCTFYKSWGFIFLLNIKVKLISIICLVPNQFLIEILSSSSLKRPLQKKAPSLKFWRPFKNRSSLKETLSLKFLPHVSSRCVVPSWSRMCNLLCVVARRISSVISIWLALAKLFHASKRHLKFTQTLAKKTNKRQTGPAVKALPNQQMALDKKRAWVKTAVSSCHFLAPKTSALKS